jgi:RNA ligase (TIGR02306 family)
MRKLARIVKIEEVRKHPNADALDLCRIGGWQVVAKAGEYRTGDFAVYLEVDSWVPHELAPFLSKGQDPKEYQGIVGNRLRSIRLRGELSQGLLLKVGECFGDTVSLSAEDSTERREGDDVTDALGIIKYEPPIPAELAGEAVGPFPTHLVPKTDQERVQNLDYTELKECENYWVTEKLDGTSATFIKHEGKLRVCGRNWEWKDNDNTYWKIARKYDLENVIPEGVAFQGEIIGNGIQGNKYNLIEPDFFVFGMYDIRTRMYIPLPLVEPEFYGLRSVPILETDFSLPHTVFNLLEFAEDKSVLNPKTEREGVVIQNAYGTSFKAISNRFLIKNGE